MHFYKHFGNFVKCIFTFLLKISVTIIFYQPVNTGSQSLSLSWYLFVRLLHVSLKFHLLKMYRSYNTPSWLWLQNSE